MAIHTLSCLTISEGRPGFMPSLARQFARLEWPLDAAEPWLWIKQLVVILSREDIESASTLIEELRGVCHGGMLISPEGSAALYRETPPDIGRRCWVTIDMTLAPVRAEGSRVTIGDKRNLALERAFGRWFTWLDDDDWQHPARAVMVATAGGAFDEGAPQVILSRGGSPCYHTKLDRWRVIERGYNWYEGLYRLAPFLADPRLRFLPISMSEDYYWMVAVKKLFPEYQIAEVGPFAHPLSVTMRHDDNTSRPMSENVDYWPFEGRPPIMDDYR